MITKEFPPFLYHTLHQFRHFQKYVAWGGFEQTTGSFHKEDRFYTPPRQTPKLSYSGVKTLEAGPLIVNRFLLLRECVVKNAEPWPGVQETETSV